MTKNQPIQILMPMAGRGSRFLSRGYPLPKPLIKIGNIPMFEYCLEPHLKGGDCSVVAVIHRDDDEVFALGQTIATTVPGCRVQILEQRTSGPLATCLCAAYLLDPELPLLVLDCDCYVLCQRLGLVWEQWWKGQGPDGCLVYFHAKDERYCFIKILGDRVVEIAEKSAISGEAVSGCYYLRRTADLIEHGMKLLANPPPPRLGEWYLSALFACLLERGGWIQGFPAEVYHSFGTPEEMVVSLERLGQC